MGSLGVDLGGGAYDVAVGALHDGVPALQRRRR